MKSTHIRISLTDGEREYVNKYVPPSARRRALLEEADRASGKRYRELTDGLPKDMAQALTIGPMFVGGDSTDMEVFLCDVWKRPVTEESFQQVREAFETWYSWVAPEEYHPPRRPLVLQDAWLR